MEKYKVKTTDIDHVYKVGRIALHYTMPNIEPNNSLKKKHYLELGKTNLSDKIAERYFCNANHTYKGSGIRNWFGKLKEVPIEPFDYFYEEMQSFLAKFKITPEEKAVFDNFKNFAFEIRKTKFSSTVAKRKQNSPISLNLFDNSEWFFYQRNRKNIGKNYISFGAVLKNEISVEVAFAHSSKMKLWKGTAEYDPAGRYLIIKCVSIAKNGNNTIKDGYTHIMLHVNVASEKIDLCIGHMTYDDPELHHQVTKTVVFERITDKYNGAKDALELELSVEHPEIQKDIKFFLRDVHLNRISSPHKKIITNLEELGNWLTGYCREKEKSLIELPNSLVGEYELMYQTKPIDNSNIKKEIVTFARLDRSVKLKVEYKHCIEKSNKELKWQGETHYNPASKTLSVYLKDAKESYEDALRPIFLILDMPSGQEVEQEVEIEALTGSISGNRDEDRGAVSRLVLAVKKSRIRSELEDAAIAKFFNLYMERSWVRPPVESKIFAIADIVKSFKEGEDTQNKIIEKYKRHF